MLPFQVSGVVGLSCRIPLGTGRGGISCMNCKANIKVGRNIAYCDDCLG
jgi:Zn finger protein HypA/HybF involved in hydrogenase expression